MYDALVVGSGAAGGWAAKELCEGGLEVLLLEAGRAVDPVADFPIPAPPERNLASRLAAAARGQGVQARCAAFNARTRGFFVSDRENPYTTPAGSPFNWFRGRQVGGRLHLWARVMLRLGEEDLAGWPLGLADVAPCYDLVEDFMGVRSTSLTGAEEGLRSAVQDRGAVAAVRLAEPEQDRVPRTIRAAAATGRLTLRPDAVVRRVAMDGAGGRATGVEYVDRRTGRAHTERARVVVLCASTIETLRILLGSGIGDSSGRLGRSVMDHVMTGASGPAGDGASGGGGDPYDLGASTGFVTAREGYGIQGGIGRDAGSWYMLAHGRMGARRENRVTLDAKVTDAWGAPAARVLCSHADAEDALAAEQLREIHALARAAGLRVRTPGGPLTSFAFRLARGHVLLPTGAFLPGSAAHEIGGAGMGADPRDSVTDPWGRLWDVDNVVVADGALFPSGCWQNVTLTIMALAVRASRRVTVDLAEGRL